MSQKAIDAKTVESKPITNSYEVKMLGLKMDEKGTSKKTRVPKSTDIDDEPIIFLNPKPMTIIVPVDILTDKSKSTTIKKKNSMEKVSTSAKEPHVHVHNIVESMFFNEEVLSNPNGKYIDHAKTNVEKPHVEPHVKSHAGPHVEPNVGAFFSSIW